MTMQLPPPTSQGLFLLLLYVLCMRPLLPVARKGLMMMMMTKVKPPFLPMTTDIEGSLISYHTHARASAHINKVRQITKVVDLSINFKTRILQIS